MIFKLIDRLAPYAAWTCLAVIAFMTLSPIEARPVIIHSQGIEHIVAFGMLAALFCIAYPRHTLLVLMLLICAAGILEVLQTQVAGRHGRLIDAAYKFGGAGAGTLLAYGFAVMRVKIAGS